jgi:hypothetical protein
MEGLVLRPLQSGEKRGRGRPRLSDYIKVDDLPPEEREKARRKMQADNAEAAQPSSRLPEGTPASGSVAGGAVLEVGAGTDAPAPVKRGRGRPRKDSSRSVLATDGERPSGVQLGRLGSATGAAPEQAVGSQDLGPIALRTRSPSPDDSNNVTEQQHGKLDAETIDAAELSDWAAGGDHPATIEIDAVVSPIAPKRGRGRPPGSKNRSKSVPQNDDTAVSAPFPA